MSLHIRWMTRSDLAQILEIEKSAPTSQWLEEDFEPCFHTPSKIIGFVAVENGSVCGYCVYQLHKTHLRILNLTVSMEYRHRKIGSMFVNRLKRKLLSHRRSSLWFPVRESLTDVHLFLEEMDFQAVMVERDYFEDTQEDAYVFRYNHPFLDPEKCETQMMQTA